MKIYRELTDINEAIVLLFMILFKFTICDLMLTPTFICTNKKKVNNLAVGITFVFVYILQIYVKNIAL
jgi:hypothetical protein